MSEGFHQFSVQDAVHGRFELLVAVPNEDDHWGVLAPLRGTVWGAQIREVSGEAFAHARHGFLSPLMREIGPEPKHLSNRIPDIDGRCVLTAPGMCAGAGPHCRPGKKLPDCYEPPGPVETQLLMLRVAVAWRDGVYVVVVAGSEFALL